MVKAVFIGRSNVGKSSTIKALTGKRLKIGRRPGVTLKPMEFEWGDVTIVDMPGFGFMSGINEEKREGIKDSIVRYLEEKKDLSFAVQIIDAKAFLEIKDRWYKRGQIPVEIELFNFLNELELKPIIVANKIDKITKDKRDKFLDQICESLDLLPPWRQWMDTIVPFSAKTGEGVLDLKRLIRSRIESAKKSSL
ncbi:MAG: GTP-binding protein EngB [Candidatus Hydrothermarchaeales archaeon]